MINKTKNSLYKSMSQEDLCIIKKGKELLLVEYDLIAKLRKDKELSQKELAEIMEIRHPNYSNPLSK